MIGIKESTYAEVMAVLRQAPATPERKAAIAALKIDMIESLARYLKYPTNTPALLRRQAE